MRTKSTVGAAASALGSAYAAMLNPHHLELFYYVARHGGISRALRQIPYGIQQPAVSGQILQLEETLGVKLFVRTPFRLTPEGEELFEFVRPFFENLDAVEARLRAGATPTLRIGAAESVLLDHLPAVLKALRRQQPRLQLQLRSGFQPELESWLQERQIDLAVAALESRPSANLRRLPLVRLPLVLLIPRRSPPGGAADFWARFRPATPLISLPATETVSRHFQSGLRSRKRKWTPTIVASSLETIARYVADGHGVGVSVAGSTRQAGVRELVLEDFPRIEIVALWIGRPLPIVQAALDAMRQYVDGHWPRATAD
jgi:DNA-binding transcriptional LysR family regulator